MLAFHSHLTSKPTHIKGSDGLLHHAAHTSNVCYILYNNTQKRGKSTFYRCQSVTSFIRIYYFTRDYVTFVLLLQIKFIAIRIACPDKTVAKSSYQDILCWRAKF